MEVLTDSNFLKPRHDTGNFSSLPQRIIDKLVSGQYDAVVLLVIDGFGWRFLETVLDTPFLDWVSRNGKVEKLTSQFPSTTASHLTTIHTGQPVGEHGVFEWNYYEPDLDAVITPLLFSYAGTTERDLLKRAGVNPRTVYPKHTIYHKLSNLGIKSGVFQHREYTPSTYSNVMFRGAHVQGYKTLPEGLTNLQESINSSSSPAYFFLYFEKIDAISHEYGPTAKQTEAELVSFFLQMEHIFRKSLRPGKKCLFLMTADHGQVEVEPSTTVFINQDPHFAGVLDFLQTDHSGNPIIAGGSCRDFFLYIKQGLVEEARSFLSKRLDGKAIIWKVDDMIEEGWFGPVVSPAFRKRAGDLVILPYRGESVWWYEKDRFYQKYKGHHGGLTPQEMEIPLLSWEM